MSSMLEQAIIDAKMLQETAQKKAEAALIQKYEPEIKKHLKMLLEQEDALGADPAAGAGEEDVAAAADAAAGSTGGAESPEPMAGGEATPETKNFVNKVPAAYLGEDNSEEIEINLDSIVQKVDSLEKELNVSVPDFSMPAHSVVPQANQTVMPVDTLAEAVVDEEQDEQVNESDCLEEGDCMDEETLEEELVLDLGIVSPGGVNANEAELKRQYDIAAALQAQNAELLEQLKARDEEFNALEEKLSTVFTSLKETKNKLNKSVGLNVQLKEGVEFLTKKINDVNLLNARLLYTNKVLGNASLNERQRNQIAESISKSKTVEEAKTIYETLQKSAQVLVERRSTPQSLTEAINRAPSAFLPRNNVASAIDPQLERWQRIAGIKK